MVWGLCTILLFRRCGEWAKVHFENMFSSVHRLFLAERVSNLDPQVLPPPRSRSHRRGVGRRVRSEASERDAPLRSVTRSLISHPFGSHRGRRRRRRTDTLIDRVPRPADVHVGTTAVSPTPPLASCFHHIASAPHRLQLTRYYTATIPRYDNNNVIINITTITISKSRATGDRRTIGPAGRPRTTRRPSPSPPPPRPPNAVPVLAETCV